MEKKVALGDSGSIPLVGFGTYFLNDEQAENATKVAIQAGYRHIDTAEFYGNHTGIGKVLKDCNIHHIDRSQIFITDKVTPVKSSGDAKTADEIIQTCRDNTEKLQTDYIDLFLLHHAGVGAEQRLKQWNTLLSMKEQGLIKHAGVSNFSIKHLEEIKDAGLAMPEVNQLEIHPLCTQEDLVKYCRANKILPIAYSSLAPCSSWRIEPHQSSAKKEQDTSDGNRLYRRCIEGLMDKYAVSEPQILLKWAIQHGYPILPKSCKKERIIENSNLFSFEMTEDEIKKLDSFDENAAVAWGIGNPVNFQ